MSSWWRLLALDLGDGSGTGSWKRRAAKALGAEGYPGRSWAQRIAAYVGTEQTVGSWTRRMTPVDAPAGSPWAERLYLSGGLIPPDDSPALKLNKASNSQYLGVV